MQTPAPGTSRPGVIAKLTPTARPGRKVARFIPTEAAQSTIAPSADGKLPELRLKESDQAEEAEAKSGSLSPVLLLGAVCLSVGLSVVLVMMDVAPKDTSLYAKKREARAIIDTHFSSNPGDEPLKPHQIYLREAQTAYSRGDYRREREYYRRVLDMLRAEPQRGRRRALTGSPEDDAILEKQISILLSGGS